MISQDRSSVIRRASGTGRILRSPIQGTLVVRSALAQPSQQFIGEVIGRILGYQAGFGAPADALDRCYVPRKVYSSTRSRADLPELPFWPMLFATPLRLLGGADFSAQAKQQARIDLTAGARAGRAFRIATAQALGKQRYVGAPAPRCSPKNAKTRLHASSVAARSYPKPVIRRSGWPGMVFAKLCPTPG
jgi:hypothetical protein